MSRFVLPTKSEWGPDIGEEIKIGRLQQKLEDGWRSVIEIMPTGIRFTTQRGKQLSAPPKGTGLDDEPPCYLVHYPIADVLCPDCGESNLVMGFDDGDECPKCRLGKMKTSVVIY